ncbi:MAG: thiazole biosynthesis adenylyltransferase ThiF [Phycisphaera sp.]|nr:thiazole biosynthesis adenylyltransferase ThiF [Phycisphaera sp.]
MSSPDRYHRQQLLPDLGPAAQQRLAAASALLVGCGALGTVIAESLTRAGVGRLVVVDRDLVELTNLQRQVLFDENDVRAATPKAIAAQRRLGQINSGVTIDAHVADFNPTNAERLAAGCDVIVDGTDNFETRYLLNDVAVKRGTPYVYGGAVGTQGMMMVILPAPFPSPCKGEGEGEGLNVLARHDTPQHSPSPRPSPSREREYEPGPCLRCVFDSPPPAGSAETCDTAGVLGPAVGIVANLQATETLKLLTGNADRVNRRLVTIDPWRNTLRQLDISNAYQPGACPCCGGRRFDYLDGDRASRTFTLCGRNAVQVAAPANGANGGDVVDLAPIAARLTSHGNVTHNDYLLRAELTERDTKYQLTLFPDGRAIVHGTDDATTAKAIYTRYVGL